MKSSRTELMAEVRQLKQWVNDLQSGMYINCVYCGHRYGPKESTPATATEGPSPTMAESLKRHIERCPKHPLFEFRNFVARAMSGLRVLRTMLDVAKLDKGRERADELIQEAEALLGHKSTTTEGGGD